jgi:hypothetical protein
MNFAGYFWRLLYFSDKGKLFKIIKNLIGTPSLTVAIRNTQEGQKIECLGQHSLARMFHRARKDYLFINVDELALLLLVIQPAVRAVAGNGLVSSWIAGGIFYDFVRYIDDGCHPFPTRGRISDDSHSRRIRFLNCAAIHPMLAFNSWYPSGNVRCRHGSDQRLAFQQNYR